MPSYLTAGQKALIETALYLRRGELERRIDARQHGGTRFEHARETLLQDDDDAPQRSSDREVELAVTDAEHREHEEICQALRRLPDDDFGTCLRCGDEIPFDRLRSRPHAAYCVRCKQALEKGAPAMSGAQGARSI